MTEAEEKKKIIKGKELQGESLIGISTVDISIYEEYLKKNKIKYKIYTYKNNPDLSLLVLYSGTESQSQREIFDRLVRNNEKIEGAFWPDSTVKVDTELILVSGDNN